MGEDCAFSFRCSLALFMSIIRIIFFYYSTCTMQWFLALLATFSIWMNPAGLNYMHSWLWVTPSIHSYVNSSFSFLLGFSISSFLTLLRDFNSKARKSFSLVNFNNRVLSQSDETLRVQQSSLTQTTKSSKNPNPFLTINPIELLLAQFLETLTILLATSAAQRTITIGVLSLWIRIRIQFWLATQMKYIECFDCFDFRREMLVERIDQRGFSLSRFRWAQKRIWEQQQMDVTAKLLYQYTSQYNTSKILSSYHTYYIQMLNYHKIHSQPSKTTTSTYNHFLSLGSHTTSITIPPLVSFSQVTMYPNTKLIISQDKSEEGVGYVLIGLTGGLRIDQVGWGVFGVGGGRVVQEVDGKEGRFLYLGYQVDSKDNNKQPTKLSQNPYNLTQSLTTSHLTLPQTKPLQLNKRILLYIKSGKIKINSTNQQISQGQCLYTSKGCGTVTACQGKDVDAVVLEFGDIGH